MTPSPESNMHLTRRSTVGVTGFEPATSSSRTKRATKLRHTPRRTSLGESSPSSRRQLAPFLALPEADSAATMRQKSALLMLVKVSRVASGGTQSESVHRATSQRRQRRSATRFDRQHCAETSPLPVEYPSRSW